MLLANGNIEAASSGESPPTLRQRAEVVALPMKQQQQRSRQRRRPNSGSGDQLKTQTSWLEIGAFACDHVQFNCETHSACRAEPKPTIDEEYDYEGDYECYADADGDANADWDSYRHRREPWAVSQLQRLRTQRDHRVRCRCGHHGRVVRLTVRREES